MITPKQIEEWIKEAEERPSSGPILIQFIGQRLKFLSDRNEELLAEAIQLRSGSKVEELESRIASLENQLELLKRQFGGELPELQSPSLSLLCFNGSGKLLRVEIPLDGLEHGLKLAQFDKPLNPAEPSTSLLLTSPLEELLLLFETGRITTMAVSSVPAADAGVVRWNNALQTETRGGEELCGILPVASLPLFDHCIQVSRRGFAKRIGRSYLQGYIARDYIGGGTRQKLDRPFALFLVNENDQAVIASRKGSVLTLPLAGLPYNAEETIRLSVTDYVINAFNPLDSTHIVMITQDGKVVQRETTWLTPSASLKTRGQQLIPSGRLSSGTRAAAVLQCSEDDWGVALGASGALTLYHMADLFSAGSLPDAESDPVVGFISFSLPSDGRK